MTAAATRTCPIPVIANLLWPEAVLYLSRLPRARGKNFVISWDRPGSKVFDLVSLFVGVTPIIPTILTDIIDPCALGNASLLV
jgi:hypothetical protein